MASYPLRLNWPPFKRFGAGNFHPTIHAVLVRIAETLQAELPMREEPQADCHGCAGQEHQFITNDHSRPDNHGKPSDRNRRAVVMLPINAFKGGLKMDTIPGWNIATPTNTMPFKLANFAPSSVLARVSSHSFGPWFGNRD